MPTTSVPPSEQLPACNNRKKLVATASRRECVYKRTDEPSVTFCGIGAVRERADVTCSHVTELSGLYGDVAKRGRSRRRTNSESCE